VIGRRAPFWLIALALGGGCECGSQRGSVPPVSETAATPAVARPANSPAPPPREPARPGATPGPLVLEPDAEPSAEPSAADAPSAVSGAPGEHAAPAGAPGQPRVWSSRVGGRDVTAPEGGVVGRYVFDSLVDITEAGPATATEQGVVLVNRDNLLWLAALGPRGRGPKPQATPLRSLPDGVGPFPLAKGPAVRGGHAYWVSRGRLLRKALAAAGTGSLPQVLREDARVGTRVAVPRAAAKARNEPAALVAYVARGAASDDPLRVQLWIEGRAEPVRLTDEISSAHSVALLGTASGLSAFFLEARTGMSTLHLRSVEWAAGSEPSLGEDRIVWVGGPSRSSTEFLVQDAGTEEAWGLMALARDITHFGLLSLRLPLEPSPQPLEPDWLLYENGIEPAPFATVMLCGRLLLALARPISAEPDADQELVLLELEQLAAPAILLARARAFFDVSLSSWGSSGGRSGREGLLVYVADQRTWARSVRCGPG
jgi:hypothetical protein